MTDQINQSTTTPTPALPIEKNIERAEELLQEAADMLGRADAAPNPFILAQMATAHALLGIRAELAQALDEIDG